jgi:DNA-binding LacI/PurR family transcriptional regulator
MRPLLFTLESNVVSGDVLNQMWRYRVDGAFAIAKLRPEQIRSFKAQGVPLVLYNRYSDIESVSAVCCDAVRGEALLVNGLVAAGHRRFGVIAGPEDSEVGAERMTGIMRQLDAAGLRPISVTRGNYDYASGKAAFTRLIEEAGTLDAIVSANDFMAIGAIDAARAQGLRVPEDLSIVGFDGISAADWDPYQLTTIRQPVNLMVSAAVSMLLERIADPDHPSECRMFAGQLERGSSARIDLG